MKRYGISRLGSQITPGDTVSSQSSHYNHLSNPSFMYCRTYVNLYDAVRSVIHVTNWFTVDAPQGRSAPLYTGRCAPTFLPQRPTSSVDAPQGYPQRPTWADECTAFSNKIKYDNHFVFCVYFYVYIFVYYRFFVCVMHWFCIIVVINHLWLELIHGHNNN